MALNDFHPAVAAWFEATFGEPTEVQRQAWPAVRRRQHTLIAAPTGSGKTLAAFLAAIDSLVCEGLARGLADETQVLYVSPLKALSNDVQKNLELPLAGIREVLKEQGLNDVELRAWVRTGDTPASERERMRRRPPHILVTTPESLFILLTSDSGRQMLKTVRTVIVDEIHALAGNKRGAHLALSLERLAALCEENDGSAPSRIGLSATQKPIEDMAHFLTGGADCSIIDTGHVRRRDLALEVPHSPLEAVMSAEVWEEVYDRLAELIEVHRTTLIFVNTRRLAERVAHRLADRLGEEHVTAHHGSLAREHRLHAERRLKAGKLRALVATASLELGIDIGDVDLVCQLGSPRSISAFLQRVGRSGHSVGALPKGHLFPLSRDDLVESTALLEAVRRNELDRILIPVSPLDVLAQQIVAEVSAREWPEQALFDTLRRAWPYRDLSREAFTEVVRMLADGFTTRRGRRGAYIHRDAVNGRLRARRGARQTAVTNGGAIPDLFDYDVMLQPEGIFIGSINEDFAFESLPGDIFQLGNRSYRIQKVEKGKVHVEDAHGQPPNIPFWFGEAPGRSDELSAAVSDLRSAVARQLEVGLESAIAWLQTEMNLSSAAARQLAEYLAAAQRALGTVPTRDTIVFERFFDETGDMHFVIHAPLGSRINRAWGLALRKRFCRKFNFELQAAATEDNVVLSLGPTHSFPLEEVANYLKPHNVRDILVQALLAAPLFATRWRWNTNISLAVPRNRHGKRLPAQFQRSDAEDLVAVVFPDQLACLENIAGDREVPDHPLVNQTLADCLTEAMDIEGLEVLLARLERGDITLVTRDLPTPSPLAYEILNAKPYAFLDDGAAEERRTLNVRQQRHFAPQGATDVGILNADAVARVVEEAWPDARNADELHDALVLLGFMTTAEGGRSVDWPALFDDLQRQGRATLLTTGNGITLWVAAERLAQILAVFPEAALSPEITPFLDAGESPPQRDEALVELVRSRLEGLGPVTAECLTGDLGLATAEIDIALAALEQEGFALQGLFTGEQGHIQWCERRLLARIHRYTVQQRRREFDPVPAADFMRFLFRWHGLDERKEGQEALATVLAQLEGISAPAAAWEGEILPARVDFYAPHLLDNLCASGRAVWLRLTPPKANGAKRKAAPVRITPIALLPRAHTRQWLQNEEESFVGVLSANAAKALAALQQYGASFFDDLISATALLRVQLEDALGELVSFGLVTADSFTGLRALITPANRRPGNGRSSRRRGMVVGMEAAGRWSLVARQPVLQEHGDQVEHIARVLLRRYGVVFRALLEREGNLPAWRELLYVYRRLEARGEIRGGRFVETFSGEQYALAEAAVALRKLRNEKDDDEMFAISAADPLNLTGIITPGQRIPAQQGNRILYRAGVPLAAIIAGEVNFIGNVEAGTQQRAHTLLCRRQAAGI